MCKDVQSMAKYGQSMGKVKGEEGSQKNDLGGTVPLPQLRHLLGDQEAAISDVLRRLEVGDIGS